jgi:hypothetical protein
MTPMTLPSPANHQRETAKPSVACHFHSFYWDAIKAYLLPPSTISNFNTKNYTSSAGGIFQAGIRFM